MVQNFSGLAENVMKAALGNWHLDENIGKEFLVYQLQVGKC